MVHYNKDMTFDIRKKKKVFNKKHKLFIMQIIGHYSLRIPFLLVVKNGLGLIFH